MSELFIVCYASARFLAGAAQLGARCTGDDMVRRATQHEVRTRLTDLRAIQQNADEVDLSVVAAGRDTVLQRHRADRVAVQALFDAFLHRVVSVFVSLVGVEIDAITPLAVRHWYSAVEVRISSSGMMRTARAGNR
jgi:hypothetical protein